MNEIAAASREQSEGIGQVNQAVAQMDEVTQQNAALVEQAAAASGSLQEQAARLHDAADRRDAGIIVAATGKGLRTRTDTRHSTTAADDA